MSARDVDPFVGWHCSGAFGRVRCGEPCAWCRDEAAKNRTALAAAGHVIEQDWQPIEMAPRDGTEVLVYARVLHPERWGIHLDPMICAASYHPDAGWCVCEVRDATHWRPLPTPPEGQP